MDSTENPSPAPETNRRRLVVIGIGVAVVVAGLIFAIASRDDDTTSQPGPDAIDAPAVVTGLTSPGNAPPLSSDDIVTDSVDIVVVADFSRDLLEPGSFTCSSTGLWQPYAELQLIVEVGEQSGADVCAETVIPLPEGACTVTPCAAVPDDWEIRVQSGVPAASLLVIVAPDNDVNARFYCVRNLVVSPAQYFDRTATLDLVCPLVTIDSVDIPYVPPATSDIPFVPPSVSTDIPPG